MFPSHVVFLPPLLWTDFPAELHVSLFMETATSVSSELKILLLLLIGLEELTELELAFRKSFFFAFGLLFVKPGQKTIKRENQTFNRTVTLSLG